MTSDPDEIELTEADIVEEDEDGADFYQLLEEELSEMLKYLGTPAPKTDRVFIDMSNRYSDDAEVIRVELRQCKDKLGGAPSLTNKILGDIEIIGTVPTTSLPQEGEVFDMHYHRYDGALRFGHITTYVPLKTVERDGSHYFFNIDGVGWRLSIIDCGN